MKYYFLLCLFTSSASLKSQLYLPSSVQAFMGLYAPRSLAYNVAKFLFLRLAVLSLLKRLTIQAKHHATSQDGRLWSKLMYVQLVSVSGAICV